MHQLRSSFAVPDTSFSSPRPTPKFFPEESFSQKKRSAKSPGSQKPPPRPPIKSFPPVSRLFFNKSYEEECQPRAVSFCKAESAGSVLQSPHYNQDSGHLFFDQCFNLIEKIGEGSFGEVFKVQSREDGQYYAVKRSRERFRGEGDKRRKLQEVNKHEGLRQHINCVGFHRAWAERGHLYIQAELCRMSLKEYCSINHEIPEKLIFKYLADLIQGLKHLHDNDLIHLDVKPDNIFIGMNGVCKLGDFGLTVNLKNGEHQFAQEGDPTYLAPELLEGKFGKPADVFSLGMTILEVATDLDLPKNGDGWHQLRSGEIPWNLGRDVSLELRSVIEVMLSPDPTRRPTLGQLIALPKFRQVLRSRRRELFLRHLRSKFSQLLLVVWSFFLAVFCRIFMPLFTLRRRLNLGLRAPVSEPAAPPVHPRRPAEWDLSFSDDEPFESDTSHNSFGVPLSNSSFSSEEEGAALKMPTTVNSHRSRFRFPQPKTPKTVPRYNQPVPRSSSPITRFSPSRVLRFEGSPNVSLLRRSPRRTPRATPIHSPTETPSKLSSSLESSMEEDSPMDPLQLSVGPRSLQLDFNDADDSE